MPNNISTQRDQIRKTVRSTRKALTAQQQALASSQLLTHLKKHPKIHQAQHLSVTLAYDGEIDLNPFIEWCWEQNKQLYLPVVHPNKIGQIVFLAYQSTTKMTINRYGIEEPLIVNREALTENKSLFEQAETCSTENLDVILTPLVAFDQKGNRIGMGGGYYDRLLAPWFIDKQGPYPIGLAHDCQYVNQLPIQDWDVPLPEIITPSEHFYFDET